MNIYSYKLTHDYGLAPNPFWGVMSLAVCKGSIRRNKKLQTGDWIIGTAGSAVGAPEDLIYAMKVEKIIPFDEYWNDPQYSWKKPVPNGSLMQMYGDNFYHTDEHGVVIQEPSAHSQDKGHADKDKKGRNVLLSKHFYYFGNHTVKIPAHLHPVIYKGRNFHYKAIPEKIRTEFIDWLESNYHTGIYGDPINWKEYELPPLDIYRSEDD